MRKKQPKYASKRLQNVVQVSEFVIRLPRSPVRSLSLTFLQAWKDRSQSPRAAAEQGKFEELADGDDGENGGAAAVAAAPKKRKRASKGK